MSEFHAISKTFLFAMRYGKSLDDLARVLYPLTHNGEILRQFLDTLVMHPGMVNLRWSWLREVYTKEYWEDDENWDDIWNESGTLKQLAQGILGENELMYDWIFCYGVAREKGTLGEKLIWDGFTLLSKNFYLVPLERGNL